MTPMSRWRMPGASAPGVSRFEHPLAHRWWLLLMLFALLVLLAVPVLAATVSGTVALPVSDGGFQARIYDSKVRVEGTSLVANVVATDHYHGTFSIANVAFSLSTKDERKSAFSPEVLADRAFLRATIASIIVIILMAEFDFLNRLLDTTSLNLDQWLICLLVGLVILPVGEVRKRFWDVEEPEKRVEPVVEPAPAAS